MSPRNSRASTFAMICKGRCSFFSITKRLLCRGPPANLEFYISDCQEEITMGLHPNHIDPRPKRRRDQANPYHIFTVGVATDDPHYYLSFVDSQGIKICMEISRELFSQLNQFELEDISYLNQVDNHYEHSELTDAALERRMVCYQESLEEQAIRMERYDRLHAAIEKLPEQQRRRLRLYYFGGLTYEEIAKIDGCSFQAVAKSIVAGERRLAMMLDNE